MQSHEFQATLDKILKGEIEPPNLKVVPLKDALASIISVNGPIHQPYMIKISGQSIYFPKIFTKTVGMGGQFDGSGVIVARDGVYTFAMCEHEWNESGANHMRGWHPCHCKKCNVDASIDSGD